MATDDQTGTTAAGSDRHPYHPSRRHFLLGGLAIAGSAAAGTAIVVAAENTTTRTTRTTPTAPAPPGQVSQPEPFIRWSLRKSIEGWRPGPTHPDTKVAHDASGWLRGTGSTGVSLTSIDPTDRRAQNWELSDRPNDGRVSMTVHVRCAADDLASLAVTLSWLTDDHQVATAESAILSVPCNRDIDIDTSWNCRGTAPRDVLRRVIGVEVHCSSAGPVTMLLRDVRQPPSTATYGPKPSGIAEMFFQPTPTNAPHAVVADAYAAEVLGHIDTIAEWSRTNNRAIHIGEWAWPKEVAGETPGASASQLAWKALAVQWMRKVNSLAIPFTPWGETAYWGGVRASTGTNYGSYPDACYFCGEATYDRPGQLPRVVNARKPSASVLTEQMRAVPGIAPSINVIGGCFTYLKDGTQFSSTNIGVRGSDYFVENPETIDYLHAQGWRVFRLPFRWDRVMRAPDADHLDPDEWGYVKSGIDHILSLPDTAVIVDQQSSAQYWISPDPSDRSLPASKYVVDGPDGRLSIEDYVNFWRLVSDSLIEHSDRLIYEITNEPHGVGANAFTVKRYTQAVVEALRSRGDRTFCLIPSFPYDNVVEAIDEINQPFPWIQDPAGSRFHAYTFHAYMDGNMSGAYQLSYADELAQVR